jgi:hypothetical protein
MLIWINLYFIVYTLLMLSLHYILNKVISGDFSRKSLVFCHYFIIKYSKIKYLYLSVILSLAGLPPLLIFYIKANYILSFVGTISFYSVFFIFITYFMNMLFYTQLYLYKNYVFDDINFIKTTIQNYNQNIIFKINILLIITVLGIIFMPDLYFVFTLFLF